MTSDISSTRRIRSDVERRRSAHSWSAPLRVDKDQAAVLTVFRMC
jgi:hypothetical protein